MKQVLIVDDDQRTRRILQILLERLGLESKAYPTAHDALEFLRREKVELILTDLRMPRMDGVAFMRALRELDEEVPVIVLTAFGTVETAVETMKLGAVDYLAKPFDIDAVEALVKRSLELSRYRRQRSYVREQLDPGPNFEDMIGDSQAMRPVFDLIRQVAPTHGAVLITGETGSGKELVARAIHRLSGAKDELFVPMNCAAIPGELLESELFGHVKGAFSGAAGERAGKFQAADGGTLFLDEIGDMEHRLQAKLLRVLQDGMVEPVGGDRRVPVDVRIVASTNRDLEADVADGRFREDLYYRLNVFRVEVPPLRDRTSDIPALCSNFLAEFGREFGKGEISLRTEAAQLLQQYPWRGNVRELRNVMERAAVLATQGEVDAALVQTLIATDERSVEQAVGFELAPRLAAFERKLILRALVEADDNKVEAARLLGIGERTLWTKLKKHGV